MCLAWGASRILLYNDAFAALPLLTGFDGLGRPANQALGRLWEQFGPLWDRVDAFGDPVEQEDFRLQADGPAKSMHVRLTPVEGKTGETGGVLLVLLRASAGAQRPAHDSDAPLRAISDAMPALIAYVDSDLRYRFNNKAYELSFGLTPEELRGKHLRDVLGDAALDELMPFIHEVLAGRQARHELWITYPDGRRRYIAAEYLPDRVEDGSVAGFYVLGNDLTERKEAEEQLRRREEELHRLANTMPALIADVGPDLRYRFTNQAYETWFRIPSGEIVGRHVRDVIGEEAFEAIRPDLDAVLASRSVTYERWVPYRTGRRFVHAALTARRTADGEPDGFFVLVTDITARREAEEALQASEARHRQLMELLPAGVYTCDAEGRITYFNRRAAELWGREPEIGDTDQRFCGSYRLWHPDGRPLPHDQTPMAAAIRDGVSARNQQVVIERPDGSRITVAVNIDPLSGPEGRPAGAINVFQDITAVKQVETDLRAREAELRVITDSTPALIAYVDRDRIYRFANKVYQNWFGCDAEAVVGRSVAEVLGEPAYERLRGYIDRALGGENVEYETQVPYKSGGTRWVQASYVPDRGDDGEVRGFFALVNDINARKEAEDTLRHREEELKLITDTIPALISYIDRDLRYRFNNVAYEKWFGHAREEVYGRHMNEVLGEKAFLAIRPYAERALAGETVRFETWADYHDGGRRYIDATYVPRRAANGEADGFFVLVSDLTTRKEVEDALRGSEERYRHIFETAEVSIWEEDFSPIEDDIRVLRERRDPDVRAHLMAQPGVVDDIFRRVRIVDINPNTLALFGAKSKEELIASWDRIFVPETRAALVEELAAIVEGRGRYSGETVVRSLHGERLDVVFSMVVPAPDDLRRVLITLMDITARRRAEERSAFLAEVGTALAGSLDPEKNLAYIAQAAVPRMADWCAADIVDETGRFRRLGPAPADASRAVADTRNRLARQVLETGRAILTSDIDEGLLAAIARDDEHRERLRAVGPKSYLCVPLMVRGRALGVLSFASAESGRRYTTEDLAFAEEIARRAGIAVDNARLFQEAQQELKRRRATEQALRDSRDRLRLALSAGRMGTWAYELVPEERVVWSRELAALLGFAPGESPGTLAAFLESVAPEDRNGIARAIDGAQRNAEEIEVEYRVRRPDGAVLWMVARGRAYFDESGRPLRLAGIAIDITERKQAEQALEESQRRLHAIFANALDAILLLDDAGRYLDANPAACSLLGYSREELLRLDIQALTPEELRPRVAEVWNAFLQVGDQSGEHDLVHKDGRRVVVSYHAVAHVLPGLHLYVLTDITDRKAAEALLELRVREQQAVAHLGRAALETEDLQAVFEMAVGLVAQTLDAEYCKVLELLPDGQELLLRAGVGWKEGLVGRATVGAGADSQAGHTLCSSAPVVVEDMRNETRFQGPALLHDHDVVSGMSVSIMDSRDRPYGVLGVHTRRQRQFSPEDVSFLEAVSHVLAAALQRHRALRELQQARADLEQRVEERTTELARLNQSLRDEIVERMGVEAALRDSEAQYRLLFERNPLPAWVFDLDTHEILAANETAVWKYGYTRDDLLRMRIDELHPPEDLERALDYTERFPPETAYMGAWRHRKHDDTVVDVELFAYEVLFRGRWARLVLANDITERKRAEQEVRVLESIARAISEAVDLDEALHAVLYHICQTTGWVLGEAWVPTADGTRFVKSPAWYGTIDDFTPFVAQSVGTQFRPAEDMVGRAWTTRQPVWVPDVTLDVNFLRSEGARAVGLRSGMAFPVIAGADVVAVLAFFLKEERREDEQLIKLVATVAAHVGLAIQRKRAEERLRESEERFRWLVEGAHDYALYMLDPDGRIASWNRGAQRLKGYIEEEVLGRYYSMFYTEEDVRRLMPQRALDRAATEGVYESEGWRVRKDGSRFWASTTMTALREPGGTLRGFVKVTRDITERREAEERLRESEARLARAQEFSLLMVAHTGLDGRWLKVPPMLCALLGYTEEELLAGRFRDITHPDDFEAEWALCQRLIRGEAKSFDIEKRFLRRDGKVIWVYQNTSVVLGPEDRPLHFLTFVRDITERREAEEQLKKSELQLSEAQRLAHLGSWEWNIGAGSVEWSEELYRIYGIDSGTSITFETYLACVHPDDRERVKNVVAHAVREREPFTMEERIVRTDGELRHLLSQGALIVNAKGEVARMVGVCLDITERKRAEERVREFAARLQSLSLRLLEAQEMERRRIARELHDQIGQDLSVIKINLQTLKRLPGSATLGSYIDETIRVVEGVLATARNLSLELRPSMLDDLGLAAALRWYLDRQAQRAGFALHFEAETAEERVPPAIETACFRLAQEAVTNVMRHARASRVDVELALDEEALRMRIVDDGEGFDVEAARARAARGESFGLLGMEERALLAGGRLEIISAPGQGTEVHVHFPLSGDNE